MERRTVELAKFMLAAIDTADIQQELGVRERISALNARRETVLRCVTEMALELESSINGMFDLLVATEREREPKVIDLPRKK
jgi:hypothetical protein